MRSVTADVGLDRAADPPLQAWGPWLRLVIYLACGFALIADLTNDATLAFGVCYIPFVCTAMFHRDPRAVWWLAALASVLVVVGFFVPAVDPDIVAGASDRGLSIAAIFATAFLVHHERKARERLIEQTIRANAAERVKMQLFTNLSHELRTPLSAIFRIRGPAHDRRARRSARGARPHPEWRQASFGNGGQPDRSDAVRGQDHSNQAA